MLSVRNLTIDAKGALVISSDGPGGSTETTAPPLQHAPTYTRPAAYKYDPASGFYVNAQGAVDPNDPAVKATLTASAAANPQAANSGGTGGGGNAPASNLPTDYSSFLGIYGLPSDLQAKINQIFAQTGDPTQATQLALAYIRGTPWYAQTYPGIQEGIARGVISNESDYRNYLNNTNILAKQYLGRDISGSEIGDFLKQGYGVDRISRIYQGGALVKTYGNDWSYLTGAFDANGPLTAEESAAVGQEQAGIDTLLGQKVQRRLDLAKQRMSAVFGGQLATPSLSLAGGRLSAPSLAAGAAPGDVAA